MQPRSSRDKRKTELSIARYNSFKFTERISWIGKHSNSRTSIKFSIWSSFPHMLPWQIYQARLFLTTHYRSIWSLHELVNSWESWEWRVCWNCDMDTNVGSNQHIERSRILMSFRQTKYMVNYLFNLTKGSYVIYFLPVHFLTAWCNLGV